MDPGVGGGEVSKQSSDSSRGQRVVEVQHVGRRRRRRRQDCLFNCGFCLRQSPGADLEDGGVVDVSGQPGGPEGSGTVLTPLQPMSPQRQALLSSRCYQLSDTDCWDLPVDYPKIKRLGDEPEHKEVRGGAGETTPPQAAGGTAPTTNCLSKMIGH